MPLEKVKMSRKNLNCFSLEFYLESKSKVVWSIEKVSDSYSNNLEVKYVPIYRAFFV